MRNKTELQEALPVRFLNRGFDDVNRRFALHGINIQAEIFDRLWRMSSDRAMVLLDIGCGMGEAIKQVAAMVSQWCSGKRVRAIGVDENPLGDSLGDLVDFKAGDACALSLSDASVDFAYSRQAFLYVSDPLLALEECYRVLRPGGMVIIDASSRDITLSPSFEDILRQTPGAEGVITYHEVSLGNDKFGCVIVRKGTEDCFRGFSVGSYEIVPRPVSDVDDLRGRNRRVFWRTMRV